MASKTSRRGGVVMLRPGWEVRTTEELRVGDVVEDPRTEEAYPVTVREPRNERFWTVHAPPLYWDFVPRRRLHWVRVDPGGSDRDAALLRVTSASSTWRADRAGE